MPGRLRRLTPDRAVGWASHPRLGGYRVVVHVASGGVILRSALAEHGLPSQEAASGPVGCDFSIDLSALALDESGLHRLIFGIGETDERVDMPEGWQARAPARLTVEDILSEAHAPRAWIAGTTYIDAAAAGMRAETIIDLIYRDYLGRPSDPHGLAHYVEEARRGMSGYDDIRRKFVESDEYRLRRKYLDRAPGSIFSHAMVMAVAAADTGHLDGYAMTGQTVAASDLARLDGADFVAELYRRVLLKEPDEAGMAHYLHQLHQGVSKNAIIRVIAGELEAISGGVRVVDYPAETTATTVAGVETT